MDEKLLIYDYIIIITYFVIILGIGLLSSVISFFKKDEKEVSTKDYFLANQDSVK
jgi:hypothetical protein